MLDCYQDESEMVKAKRNSQPDTWWGVRVGKKDFSRICYCVPYSVLNFCVVVSQSMIHGLFVPEFPW